MPAACIGNGQHVEQGQRRAVVQIGRGGPRALQRRRVKAGQRGAQAFARRRLERAHITQTATGAVGQVGAAVAAQALAGSTEDQLAGERAGAERAIGVAGRAHVTGTQGADIGGQRVEVGAQAALAVAERLRAGAGVELRVGHQPGAERQRADLAFEVLDFVEVAGPVLRALRAGPAPQRDGVAQAFAEAGEVPGAPIVPTVVVARRATDVGVAGKPRVGRVVKQSLAGEHVGGQLLGRDSRSVGEQRHVEFAEVDESRQVEHAERAVHEVVDVELQAVARHRECVGRAAGREAVDLGLADRIDDRDLTARLQRDEQVGAGRVERRAAAQARVVVVDARCVVFGERSQVDARADRTHAVLEVQVVAVAQRAAQHVVLLRRHPRALAVGRDHRGGQVVRNAAALQQAVGLGAVLQHDRAFDRQRRGDDDDFAALVHPRELRLHARRAFTRQRRRHEARHEHPVARASDRQVTRVRSDRHAAERGTAGRVQLLQRAAAFEHDERRAGVRRKRQAEGL